MLLTPWLVYYVDVTKVSWLLRRRAALLHDELLGELGRGEVDAKEDGTEDAAGDAWAETKDVFV